VFHGGWLSLWDVNELPPGLDNDATPVASLSKPPKRAIILEEEEDSYSVEYDTTIGTKNTMRLDAGNYEEAVDETKTFLGITEDRDEDGTVWEIS
jgi:hypothetical protein